MTETRVVPAVDVGTLGRLGLAAAGADLVDLGDQNRSGLASRASAIFQEVEHTRTNNPMLANAGFVPTDTVELVYDARPPQPGS